MDQDELSKSKTTSDEISLEASKRGFELTLVRLAVASRSIQVVAANRLPFVTQKSNMARNLDNLVMP